MIRERTFAEALEHRRSYYSISNDSPVLDEEIVHIIRTAVKYVPSAFNSQTTRVVLLLGDEHQKLWRIVKNSIASRKRRLILRFLADMARYSSLKTVPLWKDCKNNSLPIKIISRRGPNRLLPCTSWPSGLCLKTKAWVLPCNTITR